MSQRHLVLDIEIYDDYGDHTWAQAKYLVHGHDDVLWTNNLSEAIAFFKSCVEEIEAEAEAMPLPVEALLRKTVGGCATERQTDYIVHRVLEVLRNAGYLPK